MSELWRQCEGQFLDNRFPLRQFLTSTRHSAVFLTELARPRARQAAIKFISADIPLPEEQLAIWKEATHLDHPHIIQVFDCGRSQVAGLDVLFIVTEYADENLSQLLPKRALTAAETIELVNPLVEALTYLHDKGLVHSHIKPSNLLAINDQLKLSSDTILPSGYSRKPYRDLDAYDAPENSGAASIIATLPADIWSLGITLVEALTLQVLALPYDDAAKLALAATIPAPFFEIAQHCLDRDPAQRWTVSEVAAHLNPVPLAISATTGAREAAENGRVATSAVASTEMHVSQATSLSLPISRLSAGSPPPPSPAPVIGQEKFPPRSVQQPRSEANPQTEATIGVPSYVIPLVLIGVFMVGAIWAIPRFFRHVAQPNAVANANSSASAAKSAASPKAADTKSAPTSTPEHSVRSAVSDQTKRDTASAEGTALTRNLAQDSAILYANSSNGRTKSSASSPGREEVLEQVLPKASPKALATIHGTVRVVVRVHVDAAGNVSSAVLDSPGPSKYFADLALQAAEQWQFSSPAPEGRSLPSLWAIHFEFTPAGAVAIPTQLLQ